MADPVIPGGIRAQVIFQGQSGLPEDRFVTTWAFATPSGSVDELHFQQAVEMLTDFWTLLDPVTGGRLEGLLSPVVVRGIGAGEIRCYDLGGLPPREPYIARFDLVGTEPPSGLPAEVAVVASFHGSTSTPRTRGRVYIGPLYTGIAVQSGGAGRVIPAAGDRLAIVSACQRLRDNWPRPEYISWCILSQVNAVLVPVEGGWVDDAFDTQRRRGEAPVDRTSWVAA